MTDEDELEPYYVMDRETFLGLEAKSPAAKAIEAEMGADDEVVLAQSFDENGKLAYLPVMLLRDEGDDALVNMAFVDEEQRDAIFHCLERLDTFTRAAYAELEKPIPDEFESQRSRLETALREQTFWDVELFVELDTALYQLASIVDDMQDDSEFADTVRGFEELEETMALAEWDFDAVRLVIYEDDDSEEE